MHNEYALGACLVYLCAVLLGYAGLWVSWGWKRRRSWGAWSKRGRHG